MKIPWLEPFRLAAAGEGKRPIIIALATVDAAGDPQVRSVVCRQVDDQGRIWMTSDARSSKHCQLIQHPQAAAVAWFPLNREQFRFNGRVQILDDSSTDSARVEFWHGLSPATRATFFWPAPGKARDPARTFAASSDAPDPPSSFAVLVLSPTRVEHLVLKSEPHQARRWERNAHWVTQELNP